MRNSSLKCFDIIYIFQRRLRNGSLFIFQICPKTQRQKDGQMDKKDKWTKRQLGGQMDEWMNVQMDKKTTRQTNGRMNKQCKRREPYKMTLPRYLGLCLQLKQLDLILGINQTNKNIDCK